MKTKNQTAKEKRGFTTDAENKLFENKSEIELISLLKSDNAKDRTSSAIILGQKKSKKAIPALCNQLKNEKSLYAKIAISEALGKIGKPAIHELIPLLGEIGNNQHKILPKKKFDKRNYPLPRDIIARTICKIGEGVLLDLNNILINGTKKQISEVIDAIGHISFYSGNKTSSKILKKTLKKYQDDDVISWKIIRALSAFPDKETETILLNILKTNKKPALKWETTRSLKFKQSSAHPKQPAL
ncbi:HEAT repeat domain-containing protein [bacterium]|jgi:hypothetical protein|nr:HEAT repeat domain-containing protein [bacterium]MBT3581408.1 HEAT repeat domain-containing protein [bacterium]MBT4552552.1 HEAT repeat domain-containing protein [bacterium]MBT5989017.1 HEAT repeat domain-containing protein [bacterium]